MKVRAILKSFVIAGLMASTTAHADIGIKNFRQIVQSYSSLTGVPVTDADVKATIDETQSRLPKFGKPDEVNSAMLLAMTSLSGMFCQKMIASDMTKAMGQRRAHNTVDFTKIPSTYSDDARKAIVDEYAQLFWGRSATDAEKMALIKTFQDLQVSGGDNVDGLQKALKATCTVVGSSQEFFMY